MKESGGREGDVVNKEKNERDFLNKDGIKD